MDEIVKCSQCLDSGWRLFVVVNATQQMHYIEPQTGEEQKLPGGVKNYEPCHCEVGLGRIRVHEGESP